jgi:hypothetical protein
VFLFGGIELDQVAAAFLVTAVSALTLGLIGIACSTAFRRTLPATVTAYGAAFLVLGGSLLFGVLFPTDPDPKATAAPAPPAVTYLSPIIPLITIGTNGPITNFGVRNGSPLYGTGGGAGGTVACSVTPGGMKSCYSVPSGPMVKGTIGRPYPVQVSGTMIPSGLFSGWQYWQATVTLQLGICALILGAVLLSPIRHLPWRRRAPADVKT